ncbi:MAG: hypothetical protein NTY74_08100 [Ignavibacteriae bacterium]|nr:hypothetical protein [Ignavibacteriota bacterium]
MKTKVLFLVVLFAIVANVSFAQFDKFVIQFSAGVTNPDKQLRGNNYVNYSNLYDRYYLDSAYIVHVVHEILPFEAVLPDSSLIKNNYGAKTGFFLQGTGKINLDKYETVRLIGSLNFSSFNSFEGSKSGFIPVFTTSGPQMNSISYNYSFSNFGLGLGFEVAPLSFTKVVSPFANAQFNFNFMNAKLTRTTGVSDTTSINFNDFRMGISLGAGIEFKVNPQWGFVIGAKYDFGNLLLKNTDRAGSLDWGRTNASINDEEGIIQGNIYDPPGALVRTNIKTKQKDINWSSFYIGVNFYPNIIGTNKK